MYRLLLASLTVNTFKHAYNVDDVSRKLKESRHKQLKKSNNRIVLLSQDDRWKKAITYPLKIAFGEPGPKRTTRKAKAVGSPASGDDEKTPILADLKENIKSLRFAALQKLEDEEEKRNFLAELEVGHCAVDSDTEAVYNHQGNFL